MRTFAPTYRAMILPCAVLFAGLFISACLAHWTTLRQDREQRLHFDNHAEDLRGSIARRTQLHIELLRGLQALFHASSEVSRAQFHDYVSSIDLARNYPDVRAIQFARRVPAARKRAFEDAVRTDASLQPGGYPQFMIQPAGERAEYVVVEYNEPMAHNELAFGHDQSFEPKRREAMERARDSGEPAASAPVLLVQDAAQEPSFVVRVPVYRYRWPRATVAQRRAAFAGQLSGVFGARDLIGSVLPSYQLEAMHVTVRDVGMAGSGSADLRPGAGVQLFDGGAPIAPTRTGRGASPFADYRAQFHIEVGGRMWALEVTQRQASATAQAMPLMVLGVSLLATALLFWIVIGLSSQRARALHLAEQITAELVDSNTRLHSVVDTAADAIIVVDEQGIIESVNPATTRMLGYPSDQMIGRPVSMLMRDPAHAAVGLPSYWQVGMVGAGGDLQALRSDGTSFPVELVVSEMTVDGKLRKFTGIARDISERRAAEEQIERLAHHDVLTGLPNRALLHDRLSQAIERARRTQGSVGVMFIDLDRFKAINDSLGHDIGDELLKQVAELIKHCVRKSDTVARPGGDEFVVVLPDIRNSEDCGTVARHVIAALAKPCRVANHDLFVTPSIGICTYPHDGEDATLLMQRADAAMYQAKQNGRNNFQFFTQAMNARAARQLTLENGLRRALDRNELLLHYQPKVDLISGRVVGAEALLRWHHPDLGMVSPAEFVPIAEDTGLIVPIGEWVLRTACAQAQLWRADRRSAFRIAVNLSPRQFRGADLVACVLRALDDFALEPQALDLEITEGLVMHNAEQAIATLLELQAVGVGIAIDDFGTGHSSLAYLKRFPISELKIDRSFIGDIATDPNGPPIVSAIIAMAHRLQLRVVAEGVEMPQQLEFLRGQACDEAQGYLFGRPVPAAAFALELVAQEHFPQQALQY